MTNTDTPETLESLCFQLRKMADDAMMQIDADRLCRAADALTALQAERDALKASAEAAVTLEPYIVKIGPYHGICIGGRWDNWMFHMSANGQWVSQQKLSTAPLTPPADLAKVVADE